MAKTQREKRSCWLAFHATFLGSMIWLNLLKSMNRNSMTTTGECCEATIRLDCYVPRRFVLLTLRDVSRLGRNIWNLVTNSPQTDVTPHSMRFSYERRTKTR